MGVSVGEVKALLNKVKGTAPFMILGEDDVVYDVADVRLVIATDDNGPNLVSVAVTPVK